MDQTTVEKYGEYEIISDEQGRPRILGSSPHATVYLATDTRMGRTAALKVAANGALDSAESKEAITQGRLDPSEGVVGIYRTGEQGTDGYIAMEYCDGGALDNYIAEHGRLSQANALLVLRQTASTLSYVHREGLLHLDIKPKNIFVQSRGDGREPRFKLGDFGLATAKTEVAKGRGRWGTIAYASPEQLQRLPLKPSSDVFSMGMTIWYLLEGAHPIGSAESEILDERIDDPAPYDHRLEQLDSIADEFRNILGRMLSKDVLRRYSSFGEVLRDVEKCIQKLRADWEAPASASAGPTNGDLKESYFLDGELQRHAMGTAQAAAEIATGRRVTIITPDVRIVSSATQVVSRLAFDEHPHLLRYDRMNFNQGRVLVEEAVTGTDLDQFIRATGALRLDVAAPLIRQLADAFDYARINSFATDTDDEAMAILLQTDPESVAVEVGDRPHMDELLAGNVCLKLRPILNAQRQGEVDPGSTNVTLATHTLASGGGSAKSLEVGFATLVYWLLANRPVPELAFISRNQFEPVHNLLAKGNDYLCELVAGSPLRGGTFLAFAEELCGSEGISLPSGFDPVDRCNKQADRFEENCRVIQNNVDDLFTQLERWFEAAEA